MVPGTRTSTGTTSYLVTAEAWIASAVIHACTTSGLFVFFSWSIPQIQSDWSLSCDHGLDYASSTTKHIHASCEKGPLSRNGRCREDVEGRKIPGALTPGCHRYSRCSRAFSLVRLARRGARAQSNQEGSWRLSFLHASPLGLGVVP